MARVMVGEALILEHERLTARMNQFFDRIESTLRQVPARRPSRPVRHTHRAGPGAGQCDGQLRPGPSCSALCARASNACRPNSSTRPCVSWGERPAATMPRMSNVESLIARAERCSAAWRRCCPCARAAGLGCFGGLRARRRHGALCLEPVRVVSRIRLRGAARGGSAKERLLRNTAQFVAGKPANNAADGRQGHGQELTDQSGAQ